MPENLHSHKAVIPYQTIEQAFEEQLTSFLSYLAFKGHGVRIGLELTASVLLFSLLLSFLPWKLLEAQQANAPVLSWFFSSAIVIAFDQFVLSRPLSLLRKVYLLSCLGEYNRALQSLESIRPKQHGKASLPSPTYHLLRAELFSLSGKFETAQQELFFAEASGAEKVEVAVAKSRLFRSIGDEANAERALELAKDGGSISPIIRLEQGFALLDRKESASKAKQTFKEVMEMRDVLHFSGESTAKLAHAFISAARLRTGEAEEGLEELTWAIDQISYIVRSIETLRPILCRLLLERSYYFATHQEPSSAIADLKAALLLCQHPFALAKSSVIKEELCWRFKMSFSG